MTNTHIRTKPRIPAVPVVSIAVLIALIATNAAAQQTDAGLHTVQAKTAGRKTLDSAGPSYLPAVPYSSAGDFSDSIGVADVNGDGKPDIIIANESGESNGDGSVGVLLGNGDGTFQSAVGYDSDGDFTYWLAVADVNGDGKPDVLIASGCASGTGGLDRCSAEGVVSVLLNNGDGTFKSAHSYNSGGSAYHGAYITVADINGDGKPDVIAANQYGPGCVGAGCANSVSVLLGNGDGTFQSPLPVNFSGDPESLFVADVNGDGKPDLLVAGGGELGILLGNGDGTFQPAVLYSTNAIDLGFELHQNLAVADINGDGRLDVLVSNSLVFGGGNAGSVAVFLGNGDGTFQAAVSYPLAGSGLGGIALADVNGDGKLDVVATVAGEVLGYSAVTVLPGNGDGTFQPDVLFVAQPIDDDSLWVADVNNDGKPDVVAASYYSYYPNGSCCSVAGDALVLLNNSGAPSTASSLASSLNPSVYGQAVTFIASVTSSAGAPTGTVTLYNRSTSVGTGALINGKASISVSSLPAGSNSITAVYPGSLSFLASTSAPLIQTVGIGSSTTLLTSSVNPAATGQRIRFLATVRGQYGGAATGTVTFVSGSQILGAPKLVAGQAAVGTSFATAGTHSITAYYSGDANNTASTSAILNQVVLTATTTTIGSSLNPSFVGQAVTFTSTVSSDAGSPPNGDVVTFRSGETVIGAALLTNGTASFSTSSLRAGTLTITAIYSGDTTFLTSTSSKLAQVVNKYATATALASSLGPSIYGQRVTFTATITGTGPVPPSGLVSFKWPGSTIGTAMLNSSGVATLTRSNLNADSYPLTATYVGDANNASSASAILDQVVTETTSAATLSSSLNPSTAGQAITFTATITSPTVIATGPVTFTAGKTVLGTAQLSKGKASFTTSTLAVGSTIVTATYYGDSNITKSSASVKQSVHQ